MATQVNVRTTSGARSSCWGGGGERAWLIVVVADIGLLLWGAGAALIPETLPGPGSGDPPRRVRGAYGRLMAATDLDVAGDRGLHRAGLPDVRRIYIVVALDHGLGIATAANSFRHGERWAWWARHRQLDRVHLRDDIRPDRRSRRAVRADGVPGYAIYASLMVTHRTTRRGDMSAPLH